MNSFKSGLICTLIGCTLLIVTFSFSEPFILWACLLGASIILNVTGTMLLLKALKIQDVDLSE